MSLNIKYLGLALLMTLSGCESLGVKGARSEVLIRLGGDAAISTRALPRSSGIYPAGPHTRSIDPPADKISDVNILVFNHEGKLDENIYLNENALKKQQDTYSYTLSLIRNLRYSIYACVNFGYELNGIKELSDMENFRYYLAYPDEYRKGLAMTGFVKDICAAENSEIELSLTRLMSRVSLSIDRRALNDGVKFLVRSVEIGNCPKSILAFRGGSKPQNNNDVFRQGFLKEGASTDPLNKDLAPGLSEEIDVYMLENMQGDLLSGNKTDQGKILEDPVLKGVCSYIELKVEYIGGGLATMADSYLTYRFYLGGSKENFDIERNTHYHFIIQPKGTGLDEDSQRVDKSGLGRSGPASFTVHPTQCVEGHVGDKIHIWAELDPPDGAFDVGLEDLEFDRERGIYDYTIDADGKGVTFELKKQGSGLVLFSAGNPVSSSEIIIIVVN